MTEEDRLHDRRSIERVSDGEADVEAPERLGQLVHGHVVDPRRGEQAQLEALDWSETERERRLLDDLRLAAA